MLYFWLLACLEPKTAMTNVVPYGDPNIETLEYDCDVERARWSFSATADAWTANGNIWLYSDPILEKHPIYSVNAESDGSSDLLELSLTVVADWRDAATGSSTQFQCQDIDALGVRLYVYHPETGEAADCLTMGENISWETSDAPTCNQ